MKELNDYIDTKRDTVNQEKKETVLVLTPFFSPNVGGVETHFDDLCSSLCQRNHKVFVITYQPLTTRVKGPRIEKKDNLEIHRISWFGHNWFHKLEPYPILEWLYLFPGLFLHSFVFLLRNRKKIDVVHTQGFVAIALGKIIKSFFRIHSVASVHTVYSLKSRPLLGRTLNWLLNSYDRILLVSKGAEEEFLMYGLDQRKSDIFTYWANQDRFRPMDKALCKKKVGWEDKFVVLFVGRLIRIKGAEVLIEAARKVNKDIHFAFIVTGTYDEFLKMTNQSALGENIIYLGKVDYSVLNLYYAAADMLAVPSQYNEGFARVNLEAMLCGTPVMASNMGCLPEIINPEVGRLIEPPNADEFAKVIEYFFNHQDELKQLSDNCKAYARKRFSEDNIRIIEKSYEREKGGNEK